jgi:hypothetical protein
MHKTKGKENAPGHAAKAVGHSASLKSSRGSVQGASDNHHSQGKTQQQHSKLNDDANTAVSSKPHSGAQPSSVSATSLAVRQNVVLIHNFL